MKLFKRLIYKNRYLKDLYLYLRYHKDINENYSYQIKHIGAKEDADWRERIWYYRNQE